MAKTSRVEAEIRRQLESATVEMRALDDKRDALVDKIDTLTELLHVAHATKAKPAAPDAPKPRKRRAKVASLADFLTAEAIDPALAEPKP